jgi:DNA-binding CsgD family transcriptional regulator
MKALYWRAPPVALASRRLRSVASTAPQEHAAVFRTTADVLGLFAVDNDDRGVFIGVPLPRGRAPGPRTVYLLSRVAAHIASAWRLRCLVGAAARIDANSEAVLEPSGSVSHAAGAARDPAVRDQLGIAVRRMEVARSRARRTQPHEAVELWRGLVSGQWTLVDHVESTGRRYVLARRNEPRANDPKALSGLERQVTAYAIQGHANKYIAYILGIAPSTVSSHLNSACRKLGVASRRDLLHAFSSRERT